MARFDKLLLARYGIFAESPQGLDGDVVTVLHPLSELSQEERRGLREMACLSIDGAVPQSTRTSRRHAAPVVADDDDDLGSYYSDDDDERLIDEA